MLLFFFPQAVSAGAIVLWNILIKFIERPLIRFILLCLFQTSCQCQKRRSQYYFWILSLSLLFIVSRAMLNTVLALAGYIYSNLWCSFVCHAVICTTAFMLLWINSFQGKTLSFPSILFLLALKVFSERMCMLVLARVAVCSKVVRFLHMIINRPIFQYLLVWSPEGNWVDLRCKELACDWCRLDVSFKEQLAFHSISKIFV